MRHIEHVMGTVFSFDVRHGDADSGDAGSGDAREAVAEAVAWLHRADEIFSTYRPESFVSRLGTGEIALASCPPEVSEVLRLCEEATRLSHGYFTAYAADRLDPSGMVKGWAVERASRILTDAGYADHCVNGGGDIQLAGSAAPGRPWRVGVAHPLRPGELATVVTGSMMTGSMVTGGMVTGRCLAVATSGTAERGPHVIDPHTGIPATDLASITLVGESLTMADSCATAAFAMGNASRDWIEELDGLDAFAVTASGRTWHTKGFPHRALRLPRG